MRHGTASVSPAPYRETTFLSQKGLAEAQSAATELSEEHVGLRASALVLSSSAARAIRTAHIIHSQLGLPSDVLVSNTLHTAGLAPRPYGTLRAIIHTALAEAVATELLDRANSDLVVVTHAPLIAWATGNEYVPNGCVMEYGADYAGQNSR